MKDYRNEYSTITSFLCECTVSIVHDYSNVICPWSVKCVLYKTVRRARTMCHLNLHSFHSCTVLVHNLYFCDKPNRFICVQYSISQLYERFMYKSTDNLVYMYFCFPWNNALIQTYNNDFCCTCLHHNILCEFSFDQESFIYEQIQYRIYLIVYYVVELISLKCFAFCYFFTAS